MVFFHSNSKQFNLSILNHINKLNVKVTETTEKEINAILTFAQNWETAFYPASPTHTHFVYHWRCPSLTHVRGSNYWADYSKLSQTVSTTCQPLVRLLPEAWENTQAVAWHELVNLTPLEVCTPEVEEDRRWALRHDRLAFAGSGRSVEIHCSVRHWQTASPLHRRQHTLSPTRLPVCLYITLLYRTGMLLPIVEESSCVTTESHTTLQYY